MVERLKSIGQKLKEKWEIENNTQLIMILIVFSITGSSLGFVLKPVLAMLGIGKETPWLIHVPVYILIAYPMYQVLLLMWGTLLGQFQFFWNFEKKMLKRFGFKNL
ncbi:hypothetical protein OAH12_02675 [Cyclobacteriaceae bacterium]|nr:hypothetical protein [Cyclobacteriaceae bacterium]